MDWSKIATFPSSTIREVIQIIDKNSTQIALIINEKSQLIGVVTDGDVRRGLLKGVNLDNSVELIMNTNPIFASMEDSKDQIWSLMKSKLIHQIPIVDEENRVVDVLFLEDFIQPKFKDNWVVLMAGGLGNRLKPLTDSCPKPLLKVGHKPILETIIENFNEQGFNNFYISINYKAEMVKEYFRDGSRWGIKLNYIHEYKRMGTAGGLGLLPEKPSQPLIVMNGDLLTKVNFGKLLNFHLKQNTVATMCVREFEFQVPYGVAKIIDNQLIDIEEKPVQLFFVSAGIYVINPEVLELIPKDTSLDMPELFKKLIKLRKGVAVFPIREYWMDIGQIGDYEKANLEYGEQFMPETAVTND